MRILLFSIGLLMVVATLLPLIPKDNWWIRGFDFPRLQIVAIIIAVLAAYLVIFNDFAISEQILLIILVLCLGFQIYMIYPYTLLVEPQVEKSKNPKDESSFSALSANVLMSNRRSTKLKEIIQKADPDIILALETNQWWVNELEEFEETHPYVVKYPLDNQYGMVLYSKLELVDPEVKFLVKDDIPSIHGKAKLQSGTEIKLHCLHPRPPFPTGSDQSAERDAELLIVGKEIQDIEDPTLVLGDLNDVAWSKTNYLFQDISGLLDPRVGRGFFNTFHAKLPFLRFPLDHFFHSKHFRLADFKRLDFFGSDHFPVYIELSYEPDASIRQEKKEADETEQQEAEEKIQKET